MFSSQDANHLVGGHEELPAYAPQPPQPEGSEHLTTTSVTHKSSPWLTLNVRSTRTASSSSKVLPLYKRPGSTISGDVLLMLDKPETLQAVKISLRGTSAHADESSAPGGAHPPLIHAYMFLELTETLWTPSEGPPKHAEPPPWGFPKNGKLQGKYTFPFTLTLPHEFPSEPSASKEGPSTFQLPASWYDKNSPAAIDYDVQVTLVRGTLKPNISLSMNFIYTPRTKPDPPSELRRLAYADGFDALDPLGDPFGWQSINPPPRVRGKLANGQSVEVACIFALAKPLTYSRGSFVPLNLSLQCSNPQALDLLQSPASVPIVLMQRIITGKNAHGDKQKTSRDVHVASAARAVCWPAKNAAGHWDDSRMLMGEIALPKKLPPSTTSPRVIIRYSVVMLPFDIAGFTPTDPHSFVVDQPVDIVSHNAEGPRPRSQVPAGYEDPRKDLTDRFEQVKNAVSRF